MKRIIQTAILVLAISWGGIALVSHATTNLLVNPGLEEDSDGDGRADGWVHNDLMTIDYTESHTGSGSLKVSSDGTISYYAYQDVTINRNVDGFTLAGWNKLDKLSDTGNQPRVSGRCWYDDGTYQIFYQGTSFDMETHDWQFGSNYFDTDETKVMTKMRVELWWQGDGYAWFDDIVLIEGRADLNGDGLPDGHDTGPIEEPNLVANPSFEKDDDNGGEPDVWSGVNKRIYMDLAESITGNNSLKLINDGSVYHYARQDVPINRPVKGFTLTGWNKLDKNSNADTHLTPYVAGRCWYDDGTYQIFYGGIPFDTDTHDWQYSSGYFDTNENKVMTKMRVEAWWLGDGTAWFDDIQLLEDPVNLPPTADADGPYTVDEGDSVSLDGANSSDPDPGDTLTYEWDLDYDGITFDIDATGPAPSFDASSLDGPASSTVALRVTDNAGAFDIDTAGVTVNNVAPTVGVITAPTDPVQVNTEINASAEFTDPGVLDTHTAVWDWGDDTTSVGVVNEADGSGSVTGSHTYTEPGVYTVKLTVTDDDGDSGESVYQYVVVYRSRRRLCQRRWLVQLPGWRLRR